MQKMTTGHTNRTLLWQIEVKVERLNQLKTSRIQKTGNHQNFEQQEAPESAKRESRMYLGIQHQQDSLKISFLGSSPLWLPSYTHFPLFLLLCLGIYCFKLNFKTIVQLNILGFEKFIFRIP